MSVKFIPLKPGHLDKYDQLNSKERSVYKFLLNIVNLRDTYKYKGYTLKKGQLVTCGRTVATSVDSTSRHTGVRVLKSLQDKKLITISLTQYSKIIVSITDIEGSEPVFTLKKVDQKTANSDPSNNEVDQKVDHHDPISDHLSKEINKQMEADQKDSAIPPIASRKENSDTSAMYDEIVGNVSSSIGPCLGAGPDTVVGRKLLTEIYDSVSCSESNFNYCGNIVRSYNGITNPTIAEKEMYQYARSMQKQMMECR